MRNGAGYNKHPTDCDKFVQCTTDALGKVVGEVQQCGFSTFWDTDTMSCQHAENVDCPNDQCKGKFHGTRYVANGNCRGYWECQNNKSTSHCCAKGQRFDAFFGCVEDETCTDKCLAEFDEEDVKPVCATRPVPGSPTKFQQYVPRFRWMVMPCAPGTKYVQALCSCAERFTGKQDDLVCTPEIYLPFDFNTDDMSGQNNYVANENVVVQNGAAIFTGDSRLIIPRFTNLEHSDTIVIQATYRSVGNLLAGEKRAIVSNADCGLQPSIIITEDDDEVQFGVRTSGFLPQYVSAPQSTTPKKSIAYIFNNGRLEGRTLAGSDDIPVTGTLRNVKCALHVGHAEGHQRFVGEIDELTVFLCRPKDL